MSHAHVARNGGELGDATSASRARRILIVDAREITRVGLRIVLSGEEWVERCVEARDGAQARTLARRYACHVALIDVSLGSESGLDLCKALRCENQQLQVVLMSGSGRVPRTVARAAGARGFFPKSCSADAIAAAVRQVSLGKMQFIRPGACGAGQALSKRELDVLQELVNGLTNREVAAALLLSHHTVKRHTSRVYRKLGARNRAEAASRARWLGLVQ